MTPAPVADPPQARPQARPRRLWPLLGAALLGLALAGLALGEWLGWPGLAGPLQRSLSARLGQRVLLRSERDPGVFSIRFLGGLRLRTALLEVAAPAWSSAPWLLQAGDVDLELRYADLWRAWHGQPLRIVHLRAVRLESYLERLADGRASWSIGPATPAPDPLAPPPLPRAEQLLVNAGVLHYRDLPRDMAAEIRLSLVDGAAPAAGQALRVDAVGQWQGLPLQALLNASGALPWAVDETDAQPMPVTLQAKVGSASLDFRGTAVDALRLGRLTGQFTLQGSSLAAAGDPLGVTLPSTGPFRITGEVIKRGADWRVLVAAATVGASRLKGAFLFKGGQPKPLLSGRLGGSRLGLVDLGPALGLVASGGMAGGVAGGVAGGAAGAADAAKPAKRRGKVLPDRPFDLAALRVMDADVLVDLDEVDLNSRHVEPLRPLHTRIELRDGVLSLHDLDARTAQGAFSGLLRLDGRDNTARWSTQLRWDGLRVERWIAQGRDKSVPPWVSGQLSGQARLAGQGRSTAEILASLQGSARTELRGGKVSHLGVEAAGLDVAQGLWVWLKGDDALPVNCAVADLSADKGVFTPRMMVVDTASSAIWVDGTLSLATESLDLRAVVSPKDFSPLSLRTPLRVRGSFAAPVVSVDLQRMAPRLAAALLLALVNPLAAVLPLFDPGDAEAARRGSAGCQGLLARHQALESQAKAKAAAKPKP